jgi:hypothetical protein
MDLKPCPFCGGEVHRVGGDDDTSHDIECDGCAYTFYDISVGNGWWNTRPIEDALRAEIAWLTAYIAFKDKQITNQANTIEGLWNKHPEDAPKDIECDPEMPEL